MDKKKWCPLSKFPYLSSNEDFHQDARICRVYNLSKSIFKVFYLVCYAIFSGFPFPLLIFSPLNLRVLFFPHRPNELHSVFLFLITPSSCYSTWWWSVRVSSPTSTRPTSATSRSSSRRPCTRTPSTKLTRTSGKLIFAWRWEDYNRQKTVHNIF